jgi:carbonic anhydrase
MTTHLLKTISFTLLLLLAALSALKAADAPAVPAEPTLNRLKECNLRFSTSNESPSLPVAEARTNTAKGQNPVAVVVTCSDSRTAPEILFGKNLGRLFVVRTAGNVVDNVALGSVEYAVQNLGVRLVIVMGHSECGAVKAAVSGEHFPPHISSIVQKIRPSVNQAKTEQGDLLSNAIRDNALRVAMQIRHDQAIPKGITGLKVVPAVYDLSTGRITWLE